MVDDIDMLVDGQTDFKQLLGKLAASQLKELMANPPGGSGKHISDTAFVLSSTYIFQTEHKKLQMIQDTVAGITKLYKLATAFMYVAQYFKSGKVQHAAMGMDVLSIIEEKARTASAGAGAGGSVVSRLLRGFA